MESPIKFGTDGWRGIIARDFTFDNVRVCAQAVADYLKQAGLAGRGLIIGYDTRFASGDFASAMIDISAASTPSGSSPISAGLVLITSAANGITTTAVITARAR